MKNKNLILRTYFSFFILSCALFGCKDNKEGNNELPTLKVAISPYQDLAMTTAIKPLKLDSASGYNIEVLSMNWEDILPSINSVGNTVDVGFGSFIEYLTQYKNMNKIGDNDSILFIYPAYIFKGGGFVSFNEDIPSLLENSAIRDSAKVNEFLSSSIGVYKNSVYEMMIYKLSNDKNLDFTNLDINDNVSLSDGILAAENGSIDIVNAGLTQINEALSRGGKVVLDMETVGFADITGFIVKSSTYTQKKKLIHSFIRNWFEAVDYVLSDIDNNSTIPLDYLKSNASTKYTITSYKEALSQEYFPLSISEVKENILNRNGTFSYKTIQKNLSEYLVLKEIIENNEVPEINFVNIDE